MLHREHALLFSCILFYGHRVRMSTFSDRPSLLTAIGDWCTNSVTASATYGQIGQWNVQGVTDLSYAFCSDGHPHYLALGCNPACANFDDDIDTWDTSDATTIEVCPRILPTLLR